MTRLACVQLLIQLGDVESNVTKMLAYIDKASMLGADIVCFPELSTCGYVRDPSAYAEDLEGRVVSAIRATARKRRIYVVFGLPDLYGDKVYNSALLLDRQGDILGRYSKMHLALDTRGGTIDAEADIFAPGRDCPVITTDFGQVGMMICKDGMFPEVPRIYTLQGCEVLFWLNSRPEMNPCHLETNANINRMILVASNIAGGPASDGGGSAIVHFEDFVFPDSKPDSFRHRGTFLVRAGKGETILCADVDMDYARQRRQAWREKWLTRRPEIYSPLT